MRRPLAISGVLLLLVPGIAHAHYVPGDREPGDRWLVLPGPLITVGGRACCLDRASESGFLDVGVEVSAHHFVAGSGSSVFDQLGYGALVQLSLGGIPLGTSAPDPHLRFAFGPEGTLGPLGLQGGLYTRAFGPTAGTSIGAFGGVFLSFAIMSVAVQLDMPAVTIGDRPAPLLLTVPITIKWPAFEIKDRDAS